VWDGEMKLHKAMRLSLDCSGKRFKASRVSRTTPSGAYLKLSTQRLEIYPAADPQHHQFQNPSARTGSEGGAELLLLHYNYFSKNVRTKRA